MITLLLRYSFLISAFCIITSIKCCGQFSVGADYLHLRSKEWDDLIRTYNFARPWLEEKQPFLTGGISGSLGWYFRLSAKRSAFLKPVFSYGHFGSRSESGKQSLDLSAEYYSFQLDFNFNPRAMFRDVSAGPLGTRLFISLSPGISRWSARLKRNREEYIVRAEETFHPINYNFSISACIGYRAALLAKKWVCTPVVRLNYFPRATLTDIVRAVQGANETGLSDTSKNMMMITAGVECTKIFPVRKGKKGYGIGTSAY
ncbi:MAG: hypothetical protein IT223_11735 [Crocinitomicaceae bacterium]|nr:hypothetical protein [Crocinitomicaceae bacterium]